LRVAVAAEVMRVSRAVKSEFASASHDITGGIAAASAADAVCIATIEPVAAIAASVNNPEIRASRIHSSLGSRPWPASQADRTWPQP
jgi:hypothetical protein